MTPSYAIIVAGGKGLRMGADLPKQFLPIGGRPVLMRTLESFERAIPGIRLILVLPADQQSFWRDLCRRHAFTLPHDVVDGGATRFHSVLSGLQHIPSSVDEAIVGIHDGVRPFVAPDVIRRCYAEAARSEAVVPVAPVVETVRQLRTADADLSHADSCTLDRSRLRLVQTPQTFTLSLLRRAFQQPYQPAFTDDASVVEALGHPIALVEGNRENLKITTPFDLLVAEALVANERETS